jgi:hypothetical protein
VCSSCSNDGCNNRWCSVRILARFKIRHPDRRNSIRGYPLLNRAWAYQERLLAPRLFHFGLTEIYWECTEESFCECGEVTETTKVGHAQSMGPGTGQDIAIRWRRMVEEYSGLEMSLPSDKLPAFSGAAKQVGRSRPSSTYLAGLWNDTLSADLLWINPGFGKPKPKQWRAPSWSWAAVNGGVAYPDSHYWFSSGHPGTVHISEIYQEILRVECAPAGPDPTGEVVSGRLIIVSDILSASLLPKSHGLSGEAFGHYGLAVSGVVRYTEGFGGQNNKLYPDYLDDTDQLLDTAQVLGTMKEVYCLRMARIHREDLELEYALILQCVNRTEDTYERIGMAIEQRVVEEGFDVWQVAPSCFEGVSQRRKIAII